MIQGIFLTNFVAKHHPLLFIGQEGNATCFTQAIIGGSKRATIFIFHSIHLQLSNHLFTQRTLIK